MRIALVNTRHYFGGGDSTHTFNLADLLKSEDHKVSFFAMDGERNLPDPNTDLFVSYIDFRELNENKNIINGIKVVTRSIYSIEARKKFSRLIDRVNPDIIHIQNIHAHITPSIIFEAQKRNLPIVWTLHDYKLICPNSHFLIDRTGTICEACGNNNYYQAVLRRCKKNSLSASFIASLEAYIHRIFQISNRVDAFISPSVFLQEKFINRGFPKNKIYHIPNFLRDYAFKRCESNNGYFLFIGKLSPIKGIRSLIEACKLAPDVRVIMAGNIDEGLKDEILHFLPGNVDYVGIKHGDDLQLLIQNSLSVVLPSVWYENQPYSILEAFAYGKPVIASNLGGMRELIGDNERGLLISPGNAGELAMAMQRMVSNSTELNNMGENAYNYASSKHSSEFHYSETMKIYKKLVK